MRSVADNVHALDTAIAEAVAVIRRGGLVAFPTETVYGLGADAENPQALARLYAVKGRPEKHPVIVHLAESSQVSDWAVDIPEEARQLARVFWPGPLTLILKRSARVPDAVTGGQETVGLRVPANPVALSLLRAFGGGIAAPSANRFGKLSPTAARHVREDLDADVDLILDGGDCRVGVESTIVAFQNGKPVILRPGMITAGQIARVLGPVQASLELPVTQGSALIRVPGALTSHYAPRTPVMVVEADRIATLAGNLMQQGRAVGVLSFRPLPAGLDALSPGRLRWRSLPSSAEGTARQLYGLLRELDGEGLDQLLVEAMPAGEEWLAIADRLGRAAAQP